MYRPILVNLFFFFFFIQVIKNTICEQITIIIIWQITYRRTGAGHLGDAIWAMLFGRCCLGDAQTSQLPGLSDKFYEEISVGLKFQYNVMVSCKSKANFPCFDQLTSQNEVLSLKLVTEILIFIYFIRVSIHLLWLL